MPYVFRIHKQSGGKAPDASVFTNGWGNSIFLEGSVVNEINAGNAVNRMGTSIPSVFARPMLFQTAFNSVDQLHHNGTGLNQQLISEALDMLEFLYQNGANPKLVTEDWVAATQLAALNNSADSNHRRIAEVIANNLSKIGNPDKITLFFWEDYPSNDPTNGQMPQKVKVLIGGTSNSTLVFTSPNWSRTANENGWTFNRLDGSRLFGQDLRSLEQRNSDFATMLFDLVRAYNNILQGQCGGQKGFYQYVQDAINTLHLTVPALAPSGYLLKYRVVRNVYAGQVPICCEQQPSLATSGYLMKPTSDRYTHTIFTQAGTLAATPLALNDDGLVGVTYVGRSQWQPEYRIDKAYVKTHEIEEAPRYLPGNMGVEYAYLTVYDFIEDKIIKVGEINKDKFYTLCDGSCSYLLPLKPRFFDFFNIEDLDGNISPGKKLVELKADGGMVTLTINVPIADATYKTIALTKVFSGESIVDSVVGLDLGFFPFYKVENNIGLNIYKVLCSSVAKTTVKFYTVEDTHNSIATTSKTRTQANLVQATQYYDVNQMFDFCEITTPDNVSGMLIPKMDKKSLGATVFQFAVDFGTSNTFIAMYNPNDGQIKPLVVDDADQQVVFMRKTPLALMNDIIRREFMPTTIGDNSTARFPIKTSVCEVQRFVDQKDCNLFGNINIGFNFNNEVATAGVIGAEYFTNLKWALEEARGDSVPTWRVLAFCKQLLWILKNKAILNDGGANFKVMLTFPESMLEKDLFYDDKTGNGAWNRASQELGLTQIQFDASVTESEAPYYAMVKGKENMLNIDIGGGTTDMIFVQRQDKNGNIMAQSKASYLSVKFAADDLWGDGAGARQNAIGNNGFCQYLTEKITKNGGNIDSITRLVFRSSDVMAALFSNEQRFNTTQLIKANNNLRNILLLHYTAILFSVARLIKRLDSSIPKVISFTGMGSRYLTLISSDEARLSSFTSAVLQQATGQEVPYGFSFFTHYKDAKEITAKGALASQVAVKPEYAINRDMKQSLVDFGLDGIDYLTYADVRTGGRVNDIRAKARKVFDEFLSLLQSDAFRRIVADQFGLTFPNAMLEDLKKGADSSYNNMQGAISAQHDRLTLKDNLFFWFLKDSLCRLSMTYYNK